MSPTHAVDRKNHYRTQSSLWSSLSSVLHPSFTTSTTGAAIKQHNTLISLYTLPAELILQIADVLNECDLLSLSWTCRRIHSLLTNHPSMHNVTVIHRNAAMAKLRKDDYLIRVAKERWYPYKQSLLCSACLRTHPVKHFTRAQRAKPASERQCIGMSGRFRMCSHRSITLIEGRRVFAEDGAISCILKDEHTGNWCRALFSGPQCSHMISSERVPASEPVRWAMVLRQLDRLDVYVCPHMRTSCPKLQARLKVEWWINETRGDRRRPQNLVTEAKERAKREGFFAPRDMGASAETKCSVKMCETRVLVQRNLEPMVCYVLIRRTVGVLRDVRPENEGWCVQLEAK